MQMIDFKWIFVITLCLGLASCGLAKNNHTENIETYVIRLKPGEDLKLSLQSLVEKRNIKAGWINSCVGSLTEYNIRFANQDTSHCCKGHFEIVSLTGLLSVNGSHLHIALADSTGKTIGGHLMEGCKIYTTAEIVIQSTKKYEFLRAQDGTTPFKELQIKQCKQ